MDTKKLEKQQNGFDEGGKEMQQPAFSVGTSGDLEPIESSLSSYLQIGVEGMTLTAVCRIQVLVSINTRIAKMNRIGW